MQYKRTEYFRYTFGEPLSAGFQIATIEDGGPISSFGACSLIDLSPSGAKIETKYDLPYGQDSAKLHIVFTLVDHELEVWGTVIWKKQYKGSFLYGIRFNEDSVKEQLIVKELKRLTSVEREKKKS